MASISN